MSGRIRVDRRPAEELTDLQIERLMEFGRRQAGLLDEMEAAVSSGNRDAVWRLAEALVRLEAEAKSAR